MIEDLFPAPVLPVLEIAREDDAIPLAEALAKGGITSLEITLRTPAALAIIRRLRDAPGLVIGAGTIRDPDMLKAALDAGARFIVTPGLSEPVARAALDAKVPFLPGIVTSSEVMMGLDFGLEHFKFFPAETSGGTAALAALAGPFAEVRFCPSGGISAHAAPSYLALPNVFAVGGSWVAPKAAIDAKDWARITTLARDAAALKRR